MEYKVLNKQCACPCYCLHFRNYLLCPFCRLSVFLLFRFWIFQVCNLMWFLNHRMPTLLNHVNRTLLLYPVLLEKLHWTNLRLHNPRSQQAGDKFPLIQGFDRKNHPTDHLDWIGERSIRSHLSCLSLFQVDVPSETRLDVSRNQFMVAEARRLFLAGDAVVRLQFSVFVLWYTKFEI